MKRVLIIKMWALGDLLMATPMISALRTAYPDIHITWMVDVMHADLMREHPGIDELIVLDSGRWRRLLRKANIPGWLRRTAQLRRDMASRQFDAVINCHAEKWWMATLCVAPRRVGLYPSPTLPGSRRFYTDAIARPKNPSVHDTIHYLLATRALGCPNADLSLTIGETEDEAPFIASFEREHKIVTGAPFVVLAPFTTSPTKTWEPERYAETAALITQRYPDAQIVMTLGPKDAEKAQGIADRARKLGCTSEPIVASGTTLREYVALLRRADLIVSGDTSALHIAAALRTPYVTIFGPTDPVRLAPLRARGRVLTKPLPCAPCWSNRCRNPNGHECMLGVHASDVLDAAAEYIK